jgi:hypothetical protein
MSGRFGMFIGFIYCVFMMISIRHLRVGMEGSLGHLYVHRAPVDSCL